MTSPFTSVTLPSRVRKQLHKLWGLAIGTPDYDKREWELLQQLIEELLLIKEGGD